MTLDDVPLDAAERRFSEIHGPFDSNAHLRAEALKHPADCKLCRWASDAKHYQDAYHEAVSVQGQMTHATKMAAATTAMAIEQAQHYREIVDAGVEWFEARTKVKDGGKYEDISAWLDVAKRARTRLVGAIAAEALRRRNAS
jgi:hypothetical protein